MCRALLKALTIQDVYRVGPSLAAHVSLGPNTTYIAIDELRASLLFSALVRSSKMGKARVFFSSACSRLWNSCLL